MSAATGSSATARKPQARLSDIDPDFLRFVPGEERHQATEVALPVVDLIPGAFDPRAVLAETGGTCGVVMTGLVNRQICINAHVALRVLGPGGIIPDGDGISPEVITATEWIAATPVRLAVLGTQFLRASGRWPQLQRNLMTRFAEQTEQLAAQLALCQMPRVEDRLLAMLWLLAESWGKVTPAGTLLPLQLTHEALGAMVGARRPTITLALGELAESGAVVQRPDGWLLLQPPARPSCEVARVESPRLLDLAPTPWAREAASADDVRQRRQELLAVIARLREDHRQSVYQLQQRLRRAEAIRAQALESRHRIRSERKLGSRPGSHAANN